MARIKRFVLYLSSVLDLQDTDVFCGICMRKKESDTYDKIALAVPYKGFIENAYQIFRQHNEFYRAVDQENYEMEEVIVTSEM